MSKDPRARQREPVAHWLPANGSLLLQIESELRERVASGITLIGGYSLISAGKHDRLKNNSVDFVYILNREPDNVAKPAAVPATVHGDLKRGSHSSGGNILQCLPPHRHVISQSAMFVVVFGNSVQLEVDAVQTSFPRLQSEVLGLGELDTVCRNVKPMETDAFRVANGVQENRRNGWFPSRKENVDFPLRLKRACVAENHFYVFHAQFVDVAGGVGVHEAWRTHHVASVGQIDDEKAPSAGANTVWTVTVHVAVVGALEVSSEGKALHPSKEIRVTGECVLERAMFLACLPHEDAPAFFQYLGFNDSGVISEILDIHLTSLHRLNCFTIAVRAKRRGSPRNPCGHRHT